VIKHMYTEMTSDEIIAHGAAIVAARTADEFIRALASYVKDVVERETEPYDKIALFVHGMLDAALCRDPGIGGESS
jgi:hypothetical protein